MNLQATFAATLVDEWVRGGVTDAVVAPGSRSTPLALALAGERRLRVHVVLDERSAGFFALGLGLALGRPAVVLTTSGTAAVELHPAVVESHHARVPLLVVTADRPPELRGVGAPQTIDQTHLFGTAVRWFCDPGVADKDTTQTWRSLAARARAEASHGPAGPGPVHLNLPFRDPLVGEPGPLPPGRSDGGPWHRVTVESRPPEAATVELLAGARRGLVVAGRGAGDPAAVHDLADRAGWPVLADPLSGCRTPGPATVAAFDALLRCQPFADHHRPDVVLRVGALPASRALAGWLAGLDATQVVADPFGQWSDPDRRADVVAAADPTRLCRAVADCLPAESAGGDWLAGWRGAEAAAQAAFEAVLGEHAGPTEPGIARAVAAVTARTGAALVVSSSMPVRDVEWYAAPAAGLTALANRGANGIDGVTSTAMGVAAAGRPTVALLGDVAFLHDAGALAVAARQPGPLVLVVVDNDGGGIFSFLPQYAVLAHDRFEQLFGTPHGVDVAAVAAAYRVPVTQPEKAADVGPAVEAALARPGVHVVRVRTDRAANVGVHAELHQAVAAALG